MISFQKQSFYDWCLNLWLPRRKRKKAEQLAAIKYLVEHPEEPCIIGCTFIPNGHGDIQGVLKL